MINLNKLAAWYSSTENSELQIEKKINYVCSCNAIYIFHTNFRNAAESVRSFCMPIFFKWASEPIKISILYRTKCLKKHVQSKNSITYISLVQRKFSVLVAPKKEHYAADSTSYRQEAAKVFESCPPCCFLSNASDSKTVYFFNWTPRNVMQYNRSLYF